jgi:hypothetical protein
VKIETRDERTQSVTVGGQRILEVYRAKDGWMKTWSFGNLTVVERSSTGDPAREEILFCSGERVAGKLVRTGERYELQDAERESLALPQHITSGISVIGDVARETLQNLTNLPQMKAGVSNAATPTEAVSNILRNAFQDAIRQQGTDQ